MSTPGSPPHLTTLPSGSASEGLGDDHHKRRRFFIGPMPEKVIPRKKVAGKYGLFHSRSANRTDGDDDDMSHIVKKHAFDFFIHGGGNAEDWGEDEERNTTEEMLKRWRSSEWGKILWNRKKESRQVSHWVGGSFEIGNFLGMNIIHNEATESIRDGISSRSSRRAKSSTGTDQINHDTLSLVAAAAAAETFVKAPSQLAHTPDTVRYDVDMNDGGTSNLHIGKC